MSVVAIHKLTQQEFDMPAMIKYFEEGGAEVMDRPPELG